MAYSCTLGTASGDLPQPKYHFTARQKKVSIESVHYFQFRKNNNIVYTAKCEQSVPRSTESSCTNMSWPSISASRIRYWVCIVASNERRDAMRIVWQS